MRKPAPNAFPLCGDRVRRLRQGQRRHVPAQTARHGRHRAGQRLTPPAGQVPPRESFFEHNFRSSVPTPPASIASRRLDLSPAPAACRAWWARLPLLRYSMEPPKGGMLEKWACSVRKRPISQSGLRPGSGWRNSFMIRRLPNKIEVLLCSAELRRAASDSSADCLVIRPRNALLGVPSTDPCCMENVVELAMTCNNASQEFGSKVAS